METRVTNPYNKIHNYTFQMFQKFGADLYSNREDVSNISSAG